MNWHGRWSVLVEAMDNLSNTMHCTSCTYQVGIPAPGRSVTSEVLSYVILCSVSTIYLPPSAQLSCGILRNNMN